MVMLRMTHQIEETLRTRCVPRSITSSVVCFMCISYVPSVSPTIKEVCHLRSTLSASCVSVASLGVCCTCIVQVHDLRSNFCFSWTDLEAKPQSSEVHYTHTRTHTEKRRQHQASNVCPSRRHGRETTGEENIPPTPVKDYDELAAPQTDMESRYPIRK
jgi:hypothetical protein